MSATGRTRAGRNCAGATEALTAAILALSGPGDEVITLEPFYDSHAAVIAMARASGDPLAPFRGSGLQLRLVDVP